MVAEKESGTTMSAGLSSTTYSKLVQFCRRRLQLFSARCIAAVLVVGIAFLLLAVVIDATVPLSDQARWMLSGSVYLVVAVVALIGLVPLLKKYSMHQAARAIEPLVPDLHQRLLSAVELADDSTNTKHDSIAFREQLQNQVAQRIAPVRVAQLLPWKLVQRWLILAMVALLGLIILCLIPQLRMPPRLIRVLFPAANIARPSLAVIEILKPSPASTIVPTNEIVQFQVSVQPPFNGITNTASLELRTMTDPTTVVSKSLSALAKDADDSTKIYSANWMIEETSLEYRFVTDVGETPWNRLDARPRPKVKHFRKTIQYPSYAQTTDTVLTEEHGDITAVVDSRVTISLDTNVSLQSAVLKWRTESEQDEESTELSFTQDSEGLWSVSLPITENGTYQVHLVSADSGLTNTFSPTYRVTALVDQAPKMRWLQPESKQLVMRSTASSPLRIEVQDEFALSVLQQWTRINRGEWQETPYKLDLTTAPEIAWNYDLLSFKANRGDLLETKVVAVDRKGQEGETPILEIVISDAELNAAREPETLLRENLVEQIHELAENATKEQAALKEARDDWNAHQDDKEKSANLQQKIQDAVKPLAEQAEQIRNAIVEAAKQIENPLTLTELERAADSLAKIEKEMAAEIETLTDANTENDPAKTPDEKSKLHRALSTTDQLTNLAQRLDDKFKRFVAHDVLADLARDLQEAKTFHDDISKNPSEVGSEAWKREKAILAEHLKALAKEMEKQTQFLPDGPSNQLRQWSQWAEQQSENVNQLAAREDTQSDAAKEQIRQQTEQIQNELNSHQFIQNINGNSSNESLDGRRELMQTNGLASEILSRATEDLLQKEKMADVRDTDNAALNSLEQIAARREMQLARTDATGQFAADLGNTYRAAQSILDKPSSDPEETAKQLRELANTTKKLEAMNELERAEGLIAELLEKERWAASGPEARIESPRIWDAVSEQIGSASHHVRMAGLPNEAADALDRARWSPETAQAAQKIGMRRWNPAESATASVELEKLQEQLTAAKSKIANAVAEARDQLESMTPSVSELARDAAESAKQAEAQAEKLAESFAAGEVPNLQSRLEDARQEQASESAAAKQLENALTDLAASQNLLANDERNVARDADLSRELAQVAQDRIEQALDQASAAPQNEASPKLDEIASAQEKAADTFEAIAEHFEQLNNLDSTNESIAESRQELKNLAANQPASESQKEFSEAERLERLANADPRAVLKRLEKELATNEEMRQALSEIAENLANQSKEALEFAAQRERALRNALESSDQAFDLKKNQAQQELAYLADQASRVVQRLVNETQANAANAGQPQRQQQLQQNAVNLAKAVDAARQLNGQTPVPEIQASAQQLSQALKAAQPQLQDAAQGLATAAQEKKFENDDQRKNAKNQLENSQNQLRDQGVRWADLNVQTREQRKQATDRNVANLDQQINQARQNRDQAKAQADQNPQSEPAKQQYQSAEAKVAEAEALKQLAEAQRQTAEAKLAEARAERERAATQPPPLDSQNPNAELASRLAQQAAAKTNELANQIDQLANDMAWKDQLQASQQQLQTAANDQQSVQASVADAARSLDRAAAHEQRLNQPANAQALQAMAQQVGATANNDVKSAQQQLTNAAATEAANSPAHRANAQSSASAQQSVLGAENAIRQRAKDLDNALTNMANDQNAPPQDQSDLAQQSPSNSPLDAATMAQMLDELDRQLREPKGSVPIEQKSNQANSQATVSTSALSQAAQKIAAQLNQSRQSNQSKQNNTAQKANSEANSLTSSSASPEPASGKVASIDVAELQGEPIGAWSRLREQKAEDVVESQRETVSPRYRRQIEAYFRTLSEKSSGGKK
jgi:hypothetical protein